VTPPDAAAAPAEPVASAPPSRPSTPPPFNGSTRDRKKTVPPPIPTRAPAKVAPREVSKLDVEEAPLLDSNLLLSGEIKIPAESALEDAPLLDSNLLTSGEIKIPTDAALAGEETLAEADLLAVSGEHKIPTEAVSTRNDGSRPVIHVPPPAVPADLDEHDGEELEKERDLAVRRADSEESGGVPTAIEGEPSEDEEPDVGGPTNLELPSRRVSQPIHREDPQTIRMIGSYGKDRAEASGELKPPPRAGTEPGVTQRELVTIMPRRKTGEVPQLRPEDLAKAAEDADTLTGKGPAPAAQKAESKPEAPEAKAEAKADATAEAKTEPKPRPKAESKPPPIPAAKSEKPSDKPKPETKPGGKPPVEPPATPARRVSVEGGVVAPPPRSGRGAQIVIVLSSLLVMVAVYSYCRKDKQTRPVATTYEDAATIAVNVPDADEQGVSADADVAVMPSDAAIAVATRPDAAIAVTPRDAGVPIATADAGIDKNKEAKTLFDKGHLALEDGDAEQALVLLDQSLKMRKTARTLLERARALQRLGRVDESVASVDDAIKLNDSNAAAHEQKGMILWSAQRYSEARPALERALELAPDGPRAATIRSMLDEPR
jgi:hypothetical protein